MPPPITFTPVDEPPTFTPVEEDQRTPITRGYQDYVAKPATSVVKQALQFLPGLGGISNLASSGALGEKAGAIDEAVRGSAANLIVPQTPLEAGAMLGTGGAGKLVAGAPKVLGALGRVAGGALGGELGGQAQGMAPGEGALRGGGPTALAEAALPGVGKIVRSLPGMKAKIAADDAAKFGNVLGEISPPLKGARTVEDIRTLAQGPGKAALGTAKGEANTAIANQLQTMPMSTNLIEIPSLGGPAGTNMMTLQEANDAMSRIAAKAFSKNPLDWTVNGKNQRDLYGEVARDIEAALQRADPSGGLLNQWSEAQNAYKGGLRLLNMAGSGRAYRNLPGGAQFNTPYIQDQLNDPRVAASLRQKLGDENFNKLVDVMTRGGGQGSRDILAPGSGGMKQAIMEMLRGKGGATQILVAGPRTFLPNFGSEYAGRAPFSPTAGGQTLTDLAALRAAGLLPGQGQP